MSLNLTAIWNKDASRKPWQTTEAGHLSTAPFMKHISASIIVLAGAIILFGGSRFTGDTETFIVIAGCGVCGFGLRGWFNILKEK
jgi:hypothetical protein